MKRRSFVAGIIAAFGSGWYLADSDATLRLPVDLNTSANESTPTKDNYPITQSLGGPFKQIEYYEDGTAKLYFEQFHEVDGWYLIYHQQSRVDNGIYFCEAPDPQQQKPVTISLIDAIQEQQATYPNRKFNLVAARGAFPRCDISGGFSYIQEKVYTATISIPSVFTISTEVTETDDGRTTVSG